MLPTTDFATFDNLKSTKQNVKEWVEWVYAISHPSIMLSSINTLTKSEHQFNV